LKSKFEIIAKEVNLATSLLAGILPEGKGAKYGGGIASNPATGKAQMRKAALA
jgi:hypothetical protein